MTTEATAVATGAPVSVAPSNTAEELNVREFISDCEKTALSKIKAALADLTDAKAAAYEMLARGVENA